MNKKILLVSPNSPSELSGGGIYLRTLIKVFSSCGALTLIAKTGNGKTTPGVKEYIPLPKTLMSDVISRFFLQPTFLFRYVCTILSKIGSHDIIVFHNSRCGGLIWLARKLSKKIVICCFDNVEHNVVSGNKSSSLMKRCMDFFDSYVLKYIEKLSYTSANACSFITSNDCQYFESTYGKKETSPITIPVSIPPPAELTHQQSTNCGSNIILFTASFSFPPNQEALRKIIKIAADFESEYEFVIAGKSLSDFDGLIKSSKNIIFHSNPTDEEMNVIFDNASFYLSPVTSGSGMKTKVAEAISFGLPVISTEHSLIGYENIANSSFIYKYRTDDDLANILRTLKLKSPEQISKIKTDAMTSFIAHYSDNAVVQHFKACAWEFI